MTIVETLAQIPSPERRYTALKEIVGGPGGLVTQAQNE